MIYERKDIDRKHTWATESIFPDAAAWEKEFAAVEALIPSLAKCKDTLAKGSDTLLAALQLRDSLEPRIDRLAVYASLLSDQDLRVSENQALESKARSLAVNYSEATSWLLPELTAIPQTTLEGWMRESDALALYRHYFDNLFRQKKHILSPREEELLAMTGEVRSVPSNAYSLLKNADIKFPTIKDENNQDVELSDSLYYQFMRKPQREIRQAAYEGILNTYRQYRNTSAALLSGAVHGHILTKKARGYSSCLHAALDAGNIPVAVYDTLIKTVNESLPLLHRYQGIRRRALKLTEGVKPWDLFAPFVTGVKYDVSYEEAVSTLEQALAPLGKDYITAMMKGFNGRWVDVFPTKGKRSGAYSSGTFLTQPYILMNFHGGYEDMSTLAHEMGHSMHSYLSRGTQPYVYSEYDIFCAEVASTCNEILLQNYVLQRTSDPKTRLYLLVEFLEGVRGTVFRQTMFSEFEQRIHEWTEAGTPLTADGLCAEYGAMNRRYYGPDFAHEEITDHEWIRIPHFYYNFYVYKYATSHCAASNIAARILKGEAGAVDTYLSFLKGGSSKYPIDLLKVARVDMTTPQPIRDAMRIFAGMLDQAEQLLKETR